ncbi:tryptophan halogenase family protein [Shewanella waksmanii]|uniref:tryptophan halogenase family protein n=1 Tax=Shewanella waksmanii TaxID=213783 RepID=UPI0037368288
MEVTKKPIRKFAIIGGGTAGWIAAATLGNIFRHTEVEIELIESEEIGVIGVGEATIPPLLMILESLGIDLVDFIKHTQASFKLGIQFEDWHTIGESYFHPFGNLGRPIDGHDFFQCWMKMQAEGDNTPLMAHSPESVLAARDKFFVPFEAKGTPLASTQYALHLDAGLAGQYLRKFAEQAGVNRTEGLVEAVNNAENGDIKSVTLKSGEQIEADFFIDCTGFRGLLIEQNLNTGYQDWSEYLPCNRAVTVLTESSGTTKPYTVAKAREAGWTWRIPLQHRTGNGYVFCDKYCSDEQAINTLLQAVDGKIIGEPRVIPFTTGIRNKAWNRNCLALGLAQGFLEPLESTAIHLVSKTLALFVRMFPTREYNDTLTDEFNRRVFADYAEIRDFLVLHYCTTAREDTPFWRWCKEMNIPDSLAQKLQFFKAQGGLIPGAEELFQPTSWYAVLNGMQVYPTSYNATVDALDVEKLKHSLDSGRQAIEACAQKQPSHDEFIQRFCAASPM